MSFLHRTIHTPGIYSTFDIEIFPLSGQRACSLIGNSPCSACLSCGCAWRWRVWNMKQAENVGLCFNFRTPCSNSGKTENFCGCCRWPAKNGLSWHQKCKTVGVFSIPSLIFLKKFHTFKSSPNGIIHSLERCIKRVLTNNFRCRSDPKV